MVSVVVPTFNRDKCLYEMLESLDRQTYKNFEVLVVDQSEIVSDEKIESILKNRKHVHYFQVNKSGRCLAKNFAIDYAKGDIVIFCDDDIVVDENFVAEHVGVHSEMSEVGALSCHLIEPNEKEIVCKEPLKITIFGRFVNKPNSIFNGYVSSLNGGNMSFKKDALARVGFFDENLVGTSMLEEPDIALRILKTGYKIYFSSKSKVKHYPQKNGNLGIRDDKKYQWQNDYYFNQFFFMFRNRRLLYFPLIFSYLVYRTFFETIKNKNISVRFLLLPFVSFKKAKNTWKREKEFYQNGWYTPKKSSTEALKYISSENAFAR